MREISQVVPPKTAKAVTESNDEQTNIKWKRVNPNTTRQLEQIVLLPHQLSAVKSVGMPDVGSKY